MIRRGTKEGWLNLPISSLQPWAQFNGVVFNGIKCDEIPGSGSGVVADRDLKGGNEGPLMVIPRELILSLERVKLYALSDQNLNEVLMALGDFARTPRGAIMIFLLVQATIACPDLKGASVGTRTPFVEYIKFLPEELLPTSWSSDERYLLKGTTLQPAVDAKLRSLQREYENLRNVTEHIRWCANYWWNDDTCLLDFDDWRQVDAMYRSRALEYPGIGDAMVPCIDMANHAAGDNTAALYETDDQGNAVLLLRDGFDVKKGSEITITYGDDKGACEMVFSYGFIDRAMIESAKEMFLGLEMLPDDPLGPAKQRVSTAAPGVKLTHKGEKVEWYSEFVWLVIVNEEDGLDFEVLQTTDGNRELQILWKGKELKDITTFRELLAKEAMWEVYRLRAAAVIQERVGAQLQALREFNKEAQTIEFGEGTGIRERAFELAAKLHELENELLWKASQSLEAEVEGLSKTETVMRYIAEVTGQGQGQEEEWEDDLS